MMGIRAKYINITLFSNDKSIKSIRESATNIKIHELSNRYEQEMELTSYALLPNHSYGQFALTFDKNMEPSEIFISKESKVDVQNDSLMHRIINPKTGQNWWIESGKISERKYNGKNHYFYKSTSLSSSAGIFYIHFLINNLWNVIKVSINNNKTLTSEGVKNLVDKFKNNFYKLIVDKESIGKIDFLDSRLINNNIELNYLDKIIDSLDIILKKPYKTLNHITEKQKAGFGQSTQRTFIEYAQNSDARYYSSRVIKETVNNEVNGYLVYIIQQIIFFLQSIQSDIIINNQLAYSEKLETLKNQYRLVEDPINIIPESSKYYLDNQRSIVAENIKHWIRKSVNYREIKNELHENFTLKFILGEKHAKRNGFYITQIEGSKFTSKFLYFNENMVSILTSLYQSTILIKASVEIKEMETYKGEIPGYRIITLDSIKVVELYSFNPRTTKENYSKENIDIKENIKRSINVQHGNIDTLIQSTEEYSHKLVSIINHLNSRLDKLLDLGIKPREVAPASVVYNQNIDYSHCLNAYHKLKVKEYQNNLKLMHRFMQSILPSDLPSVYERWCLLEIIGILINDFKFIPTNHSWKNEVINSIVSFDRINNKNNISQALSIRFEHHENRRSIYITLFYEGKLYNNRRPDYRISYDKGNKPNTDLVMDAKFHDPISLSRIVKELAENNKELKEKDYREVGNNKNHWVYILCPSLPVISEPTSYTVWSKDAYYGGNLQFEWDENIPMHKHGGILLTTNPSKHSSQHNLQRLLAMYFQMQGFSDCILCGSEVNYKEQKTESNLVKYSCTCTNNECRHFFIKTHCQNCKTRLFKHGAYWTYHTLSPVDPNNSYNIACPKCGHFLPPRENN